MGVKHLSGAGFAAVVLAVSGCGGNSQSSPPDVEGLTASDAVAELEQAGFDAVPANGFGFAISDELFVCEQLDANGPKVPVQVGGRRCSDAAVGGS